MTLALITGATSGIGAGFAERFARLGYDLVLVARDSARLDQRAAHLADAWSVEIETLTTDLSTDDGCALVEHRISDGGRPVDVLVNNAGFSLGVDFLRSTVEDEERMLCVLARAPMRLSKAALPGMLDRDRGTIITVSSVAGLLPHSTYGAAKAWAAAFSTALSLLVEGTGVRAIALCPGLVHTEFHQRSRIDVSRVPGFMWLDVDRVVDECLRDLGRGKSMSIPSRRYRLLTAIGRRIPGLFAVRIARRRGLRNL